MLPNASSGGAFDRAEYSLEQPIIVIALLVGGLVLVGMGLLRLVRRGFAPMPFHIAVLSMVAGVGVLALATALSFADLDGPDEPMEDPHLPLDPHTMTPPGQTTETDGEVIGRVLTAEGEPAAGVEVFLVPLFEEGEETSATTGADGGFTFDDVSPDPGSPYVAEASFDSSRFASEVLRSPRTSQNPVRITVAPTTTDDQNIAASIESVTLHGDESGLQALHVLSLENLGEEAFTGPLALPLLPGATAIDPGAGLDRRNLTVVGGSLVSTSPILPGPLDITYTYLVPLTGQGIVLERRLALDTVRFELLVGGELELAEANGLDRGDPVSLGAPGAEQTYASFSARNLLAGDTVAARVEMSSGPSLLGPALAAAGLAVLLLLVLLPVWRRRGSGSEPS